MLSINQAFSVSFFKGFVFSLGYNLSHINLFEEDIKVINSVTFLYQWTIERMTFKIHLVFMVLQWHYYIYNVENSAMHIC